MRAARTWHLRQLLLLLAAIALLPFLAASGWAVKTAIEQRRSEVERSALDLSRALATAVGTELQSTVHSLRTLSESAALASDDLPAFYQIARRAQQTYPAWQSVILADREGRLLFNTARPYGDSVPRIVDMESLRRAIDSGRPVVGSALVGPLGNLAFPVRVPVYRDTSVAYVLSAAVEPERILHILRRQKVPSDWVVAVFDASGKRVARSREHSGTAPSPSLANMLAGGGDEGVGMTTTLEGMRSVTAFTRVQGYSWTVAVGIPESGARKTLLSGTALYFAGILASLLAWVFAASWLSRRIAEAVGQLRQRATGLVREGRMLEPAHSPIREINEADAALVALSQERAAIEVERERLLESLQAALDASRLALLQAEEAGRAKDNFLSMLGHEMRNPLAPIVSALDLLDLRGDERSARERAILRRQVDHLHRLVDDLLDVSRIVQGNLKVHKQRVDLRQITLRAQESVRFAADASRTRLELELADVPVPVDGDPGRLEQAVNNLLSNALRFASGGMIRVSVAHGSEEALLVVEDNGAGMDAATLDNLFKPFFQAPQSLARSRGGLGLGLSIVRTIVELHDGRVRAESGGPGKGSRFEIRLPLAAQLKAQLQQDWKEQQAQQQEQHAGMDKGNGKGRRVLVVDDNVDAAEMIAAGLRSAGHDVRTAHSGSEALDLMSSFRPEVAILDIGMPKIDGYQLARAMRERDASWTGRLVALSGYGQIQDKERARDAGFDHHCTKPVALADLNQIIAMLRKA